MVSRITSNVLSVDGLKVYKEASSGFYLAVNKKMIGSIRLQALYLFLEKEERRYKERFEMYVDNIIDKLIYNHEQ